MLISKIEESIESFARRQKFQFSEIDQDMCLITAPSSLRHIDVVLLLNGEAVKDGISYYKEEEFNFTIELNSPDVYFQVVKELVKLETGILYKGVAITGAVHLNLQDGGEPLMVGVDTTASFKELYVTKKKAYCRGTITVDFELTYDMKKTINGDVIRKMFKDGTLEFATLPQIKWINFRP